MGYHPEAELKGFPSQGGVPPWEEMRNPGGCAIIDSEGDMDSQHYIDIIDVINLEKDKKLKKSEIASFGLHVDLDWCT